MSPVAVVVVLISGLAFLGGGLSSLLSAARSSRDADTEIDALRVGARTDDLRVAQSAGWALLATAALIAAALISRNSQVATWDMLSIPALGFGAAQLRGLLGKHGWARAVVSTIVIVGAVAVGASAA